MKKKFLSVLLLIAPIVTFAQEKGLDQKIDEAFQPVSDFFNDVIFFEVLETPFVLVLLVLSAAFFTIYFGFPNIRFPINKPGPIEKNIQATVTIHALGFRLLLLIDKFL